MEHKMRGKHADADTNSIFLNHIIYFYVLQEILQHGHSFEVEKILSDERYQILKVSRQKKTCLLSPFWCFQITVKMICICYL